MKQICSNCGFENIYKKGEYKGRENTLCKKCGHTLTITAGFFDGSANGLIEEVKKDLKKIKQNEKQTLEDVKKLAKGGEK